MAQAALSIEKPQDTPSALAVFGSEQHEDELQREIDAREAVQQKQVGARSDALGGDGT